MASLVYNNFKFRLLEAYLATSDDIRAAILSTNTTADTENSGINFVGDFTTLDEYNGSGYVRKALTETANVDDANTRGEFDFSDITWSSLGAGTRDGQGLLIYLHATNDADSIPLFFIDFTSNFTGNGGDVTFQVNAEGALHCT